MHYLRRAVWGATVAYWLLIFTLTHLPPKDMPAVPLNDKVEHVLAYGALAGLLGLALQLSYPRRPAIVWLIIPILLAYGAIDEWTQLLVHRSCELNDWLADGAAATIAAVLLALLRRVFGFPFGVPRDASSAASVE